MHHHLLSLARALAPLVFILACLAPRSSALEDLGQPLERADMPLLLSERKVDMPRDPLWAVPTVLTFREEVLGPDRVPAGTRLHYTPTGWVRDCLLPEPTELQGLPLRGDGQKWMTAFHPDGTIHTAWLDRSVPINGLPCARATIWAEWFGKDASITLHPDGSLASCRLARSITLEGRKYRRGQRVFLDPEGRLMP